MRVNNVIKLSESLHTWFHSHRIRVTVDVDAAAVARAADRAALAQLAALTLTCAVSAEDPTPFVQPIVSRLASNDQSVIKRIIETTRRELPDSDANAGASAGAAASSASSTAELEELHSTIDDLRANQDSLQVALDSAIGEKRQLLAVVADLELRVRDAERHARTTADALAAARNAPPPLVDPRAAAAAATAAAEEEIAQLRAELEQREAELSAAKRQIEHAQKLERQLLQANDDAELAREATERARIAEAALVRMREKMDQFNMIKQQLDDANAQLAARADAGGANANAVADDDLNAIEVGRLRAQLSAVQLSLQARDGECARLRTQALEAENQIAELQQLASAASAVAATGGGDSSATSSSWQDESSSAAAAAATDAELTRLRADNASLRQQLAAAAAATTTTTSTTSTTSIVPVAVVAAGDDATRLLNEARERITALTTDKTRLEGYLKTAKQMIREMRSKEKVEKDTVDTSATRDLSATVDELRQQLSAKEEALSKLNARLEESTRLAQREQQLMLTAFFEAGLELQRLKVGARSTTGGQQSFLQRQRAAANKRERL
jgi:chromosome segregation ATPase